MRVLLAASAFVLLLSGCGHPICVAGIGNCDVYKKWTKDPGTGVRPTYTLTATPATVGFGGQSVLKLTTTNPRAPAANCEWKVLETGVGAAQWQPDPQPTVFGALCTGQFTAPATAGAATIRVTEKSSGVTSQAVITVTAP